ncbi:hypothetical protein ACQKWADRAFT_273292 [Trichoderma austrokoningii]
MDSSFRSTVLHRHGDDDNRDRERERERERDRERDRDRDRERERRDVMNPAGSHRHSTFSLRSPSTEFHPPLPYSNPHHQSPPRLHQSRSPYMASSTPASSGAPAYPLPPAGHHYGPVASASPLHPPSAYYPPPASTQQQPAAPSASSQSPSADSHHHHLRDKQPAASGRVYDPTTDTTKERPIADSRHNAPPVATPKVSSSTLAIAHFHFLALSPPRHALFAFELVPLNRPSVPFFLSTLFLQTARRGKKKSTITSAHLRCIFPKTSQSLPPLPCYIIAIPDFLTRLLT